MSGAIIASGSKTASTSSDDGETQGFKEIELTPKQKGQWADTGTMVQWQAPGFRHLWYKMLSNHNGPHSAVMSRGIPIAATDGKNLIINPDTFFEYGLAERAFACAHEIVHNVYGDVELLHRCQQTGKVPMHDGTSMDFDNECMQHAMDYRINALLEESKIGKPIDGCLLDPKMGLPSDSVLDVYKRVYHKKEQDGSLGAGAFDILLPPGKSKGQNPQQAAASRNQQQWAVEVAAAQTMEQIRTQGKMAGALQRMFQSILQPEVPWTDHIRGILARRVGSGSYDWHRPDRRFIVRDIFLPSRSGHGAGHIVVWGDTSGSVGRTELEANLAELSGIIDDCKPKRLTVLWCDAAISHVDELEDGGDLARVQARGVGGGGGTSCKPCFEWIEENCHEKPDMFIGFTDGYVSFPPVAPAYPVIWCSYTDHDYPWGEVVRIHPGGKQ